MASLKKISVKGYRSIKELSLELSSLNILIGANGSGKSNFISFFKMLNEMMGHRLQLYIGTSGFAQSLLHFGPKVTPQFEGELEFATKDGLNWYSMRMFHATGDTLIFANETLRFHRTGFPDSHVIPLGAGHKETRIGEGVSHGDQTAMTFRYLLNKCQVYHFHDTSPSAKIRQACYIHDDRWLMADAGNLAAMLYAYRQRNEIVYKRIVSTIRKIMPDFDDFDLEPSRMDSNYLFLNWRKRGSDYLFGPHQISDGTLRGMAILTLFLQPKADLPDVIILDEPELGLHPHALELVAGLIRAASLKSQVIVATQSQNFLNHFEPAEIITVESHQSESLFQRLEPEKLEDWLEDYSIGELWRRNVIGGGPLP